MDLPKGFRFAGTDCGIKSSGNDLGLIVADQNCVASGVYTRNIVRAACIDYNRSVTPTDVCRGLVVNSGNANACTGQQGKDDCCQTARWASEKIGCDPQQVLVLSTGVIGQTLPMERIESGIHLANLCLETSSTAFNSLADSFLTTDKYRKTRVKTTEGKDGVIRLAGIAKGAGMIGPNMATMLCVLFTDACLSPSQSQKFLTEAVDCSFNRISVDGHTSTNDAVVLLSSGDPEKAMSDPRLFESQLHETCLELAKMIPADGEGASRLIEIAVNGAKTTSAADQIARTVAASNLVKTAIHGCDPNWGRIVSAAGYSGVDFAIQNLSLAINGFIVFKNGSPMDFDESAASDSMSQADTVLIELTLGNGNGASRHWTSDLTKDYVALNAEYRT